MNEQLEIIGDILEDIKNERNPRKNEAFREGFGSPKASKSNSKIPTNSYTQFELPTPCRTRSR